MSAWLAVGSYPGSKVGFRELPCSQRECGEKAGRVICGQRQLVQCQKKLDRDEGCSLVTIYEWMIPGDTVAVGCCKISDVGLTVGGQMLRARQRRLEQTFIAYSGCAAVLG